MNIPMWLTEDKRYPRISFRNNPLVDLTLSSDKSLRIKSQL
jgi:hypothetical protein